MAIVLLPVIHLAPGADDRAAAQRLFFTQTIPLARLPARLESSSPEAAKSGICFFPTGSTDVRRPDR